MKPSGLPAASFQTLAGATAAGALFLLIATRVSPDALTGAVVIAASCALTLAVTPTFRLRLAAVWLALAIGSAAQIRLGDRPTELLALVAAAAAVYALVSVTARVFAARPLAPRALQRTSIIVLAVALGVRLLTGPLGDLWSGGIVTPLGSVQIGEFTRLAVIVATGMLMTDIATATRTLSVDRDDWRAYLLGGGLVVVNLLLLAVVDSGPALIFLAAGIAMAAVAFGPVARLVKSPLLMTLTIIVIVAGAAVVLTTGVGDRLAARWSDVVDPGYQLGLALHALQSGGFIGLGMGSSPTAGGIPAAGSDYLPIVVAADLGIAVLIAIVTMLMLVFGSLAAQLRTARSPWDVAATGVVTALFAQLVISGFGVIGVLPLSGVSMPVLTVTGSALMSSMIGLALVNSVLVAGEKREPRTAPQRPALPKIAVALATAFLVCGVVIAALPVPASSSAALIAPRGDLVTSDGQVIATTAPDGVRQYPGRSLYTELGLVKSGYAAYGIEASASETLTCGGHHELGEILLQVVRPLPCHPATVVTTIDSRMQTALAVELDSVRGAGVVLDSRTGGVLALYSTGLPDPDSIGLNELPPSAAREGASAPGSTFKIVVATAALLDGVDAAGTSTSELMVGGESIYNSDRFDCPDLEITTMLASSCNTTAGALALRVGQGRLAEVASHYFGADSNWTFDGGPVSPLSTGLGAGPLEPAQLARSGFGQESVLSSPLALAAATAVIARSADPGTDGPLPAPHLVDGVCDTGESVAIEASDEAVLGARLPQDVAEAVLDGMRGAVEEGTATALLPLSDGVDLAAKTGTSEVPTSISSTGIDTWITVVVDGRWIVTLLVHDVDPEASSNAATELASAVLPALQLRPDSATLGKGESCATASH